MRINTYRYGINRGTYKGKMIVEYLKILFVTGYQSAEKGSEVLFDIKEAEFYEKVY